MAFLCLPPLSLHSSEFLGALSPFFSGSKSDHEERPFKLEAGEVNRAASSPRFSCSEQQ